MNYKGNKGSQKNMSVKTKTLDMSIVSSKFQITLKKSVREPGILIFTMY